jgi:isopenicillin N synthase-like dioxygenase
MSERIYNLKDDGVTMVTYPASLHGSVQEAAELWQEFCALPESVKKQFGANDHQWTIGYESKDGMGQNGDTKENFDYARQGNEALNEVANRIDSATARQFISAVHALGDEILPMVENFGRSVEAQYGAKGFGDKAKKSAPNAFFRFLHYPKGQEDNGVIAEPHVDHSGFTFHLFETTDGCERLTFDNRWVSLPVADGQAAAFASMQTQLETEGKIKALAHRVIANETSAMAGRYAIVCFIALEGAPTYNKAKYGRLQGMEPGFNYDMPLDAFAKLFK